MTLPDERTRAILRTQAFLRRLADPRQTPRVPHPLRREAIMLLRHYPNYIDLLSPSESLAPVLLHEAQP